MGAGVKGKVLRREKAITKRALLMGLVGVIILAWSVPVFDLLIQGTWIASCHLPIGAFNLFVILLVANAFLKWFRRSWALTRQEILVVYSMMLVGSSLPSFGFTEYLFPTLAGTLYYATPENRWAERCYRYLPQWFVPWDIRLACRRFGVSEPEGKWWDVFYSLVPEPFRPAGQGLVRMFYEGVPPGSKLPLSPWFIPTGAWSLLAIAFFFALFSLSALSRRQWMEHDRLTFPLTHFPLEMTEGLEKPQTLFSPFWQDRLVWFGALPPLLIHGINGLHAYFPSVPEIRLSFPLNPYLKGRLFSQIGPFIAIVHFSVIGVTFLLPSDLAFSLWFFFFVFMAQSVILTWLGRQIPNFPGYATPSHAGLQMFGAFFAIAGNFFWVGRDYWRRVFLSALGHKALSDTDEPLPYPVAFWGFLAAFTLAVLWCSLAGASFPLTVFSWSVLFVIAFALTRFVSEGGLLFIQAFRPSDLLIALAGTKPLSERHMTVMAFVEKILMFDLRTFLMPFFMDSYRIARFSRIPLRDLGKAMWLAIFSSLISSSWSFLSLVYRRGANTMMQGAGRWFLQVSPRQVLDFTVAYMEQPRNPTPLSYGFFLAGFFVTFALYRLRHLFAWFPFHPLGYAMGPSWPMIQLWFSTMLGWLFKALLLHYGGLKGFQSWRRFFLGLLIGEYLAAGMWLMIDYTFGKVGHRFFLF